jgi:hypothetical protein
MVYYNCDYEVPELNPSSTTLKEHSIIETGSVSALRWKGGETSTPLVADFNQSLSNATDCE